MDLSAVIYFDNCHLTTIRDETLLRELQSIDGVTYVECEDEDEAYTRFLDVPIMGACLVSKDGKHFIVLPETKENKTYIKILKNFASLEASKYHQRLNQAERNYYRK